MTQRPSITVLKQQQESLHRQMLSFANLLSDTRDEVKQLESKLEIVEDQYEDVTKLIKELEEK